MLEEKRCDNEQRKNDDPNRRKGRACGKRGREDGEGSGDFTSTKMTSRFGGALGRCRLALCSGSLLITF